MSRPSRQARKLVLAGVAVLLVVVGVTRDRGKTPSPAPAPAVDEGAGSTEWGWPLPYEPVSEASVAWLKAQGWWPLSIGTFADVPGYSAHYAAMKALHLLEKRGLQVEYISFLSGPPILEAFIAGQTQVTHYGDFPFWNTVDKGNPAVVFALTGVNNEAALLVRPDSPLQSADDLAGAGQEQVIGTTLGSYCEFYMAALGEQKGLTPGEDYRLAGMSMREAQLLPKGTDAVAIWDPHVSFAVDQGLGRRIDSVFPYYFATGFEFVRGEIDEHAPDVVQALADAVTEAVLYARMDPEQVADWYRADKRIAGYDRALIVDQVRRYLALYKPTYKFVHADFWATEDERVVQRQHELGRLVHDWSAADLRSFFRPAYLEETYRKLGWAVPERPVFLPADWAGTVGEPPYPEYDQAQSRSEPQPFPEAADLADAN